LCSSLCGKELAVFSKSLFYRIVEPGLRPSLFGTGAIHYKIERRVADDFFTLSLLASLAPGLHRQFIRSEGFNTPPNRRFDFRASLLIRAGYNGGE
jgi:hypothetical protein